jgi:hypothetical protein
LAYTWLAVGTVVVALVPSPKSHAYAAICPKRTVDAEASNVVAAPAAPGLNVNAAAGAWSGVIAMPRAVPPTGIAVPALPEATSIGVTALPWVA